MKTNFLIIVLVLLMIGNINAQKVSLVLTDSVVFNFPPELCSTCLKPHNLQLWNDTLYQPNPKNHEIIKYNKQGIYCGKIVPTMKKKYLKYGIENIHFSPSGYSYTNPYFTNCVLKFNTTGLLFKKSRIKNYKSYGIKSSECFYEQYKEGQNIYLPLNTHSYNADFNINYTKQYNQKLIGVFNQHGKIINAFGEYDSIYKKKQFLNYINGISFCSDTISNLIYVNCEASHKINAYTLEGKLVSTFGEIAQHSTNNELYMPVVRNYKESNDSLFLNTLITSNYLSIFSDSQNQLFFRFYRASIKDTTHEEVGYKKALEAYQKTKPKSCFRPSYQDLDRLEMTKNKPYYLQIYDLKTKKMMQEVYFGNKGLIPLYSSKGEVWFQSMVDEKKNYITVYKYKVLTN